MVRFWDAVNKVIRDADILLLVLDSRLSDETRNKEIEDKLLQEKKPFIYALTKCDLITQKDSERLKKNFKPSVFVSSTEYHGLKKLRELIIILGKKNHPGKDSFTVGVLGYPNTGKSSLINAINGRSSAGTSSVSGFTKGIQRIKADNTIVFLDSPGVIPYSEKDEVKHSLIGTIDYNKTKDPDLAIFELMKSFPGLIEHHYGVSDDLDDEEKLELIAKNRNILKKGGDPDVARVSKVILKDWQEGRIK